MRHPLIKTIENSFAPPASENAQTDLAVQPGILLLDDDPFMLAMESRILQSMGHAKISIAGDAKAAMAILQRNPQAVDVILCDLNMPGVDGIEFLQALGASPFCASVILLSGEGTRVMHTVHKLLEGSGLKILGSIEKPASRAQLGTLLDRWKPISRARAAGPQVVFTPDEVETANRERQWVLHYQPKVDLTTARVCGMEALVRWNHPKYGLVYPDRFIPIAEHCGAIDAMTRLVLQEALGQIASWHRLGQNIQVAVNVSMENLRLPNFASLVNDMACDAGVSPRNVILEITESCLMSTGALPLENLVRLRLKRFGLSIDDFGTGHSSLVQLRDVPFTELKIDRGFVQGARDNQITRPILEGSLSIAKRLDIRSVAEGVETEDDWHLLREIGCDAAQGYFIGRPMPADQVPEWIELWKERRLELIES